MLSTEKLCDAVVFIWKIENFSLLTNDANSSICSSPFVSEAFGNVKWKLKLLPKGKDGKYVSLFLNSETDDEKGMSGKFTISLLCADDSLFIKEEQKLSFGYISGYSEFISREELFKCASKFLPKDNLSIRCQMWKYQETLHPNLMLNKTTVMYEQTSFIWVLEEFNKNNTSYKETTILSFKPNITDKLSIEINNIKNNSASGEFQIIIRRINNHHKNACLKCSVSVLDASEKHVLSQNAANHIFKYASVDDFMIPFFSVQKLSSNPNLYLPNGNLSLHFDFILSGGDIADSKIIRFAPIKVPRKHSTLKKDFLSLYLDKKFCDVTLRSEGKLFEAHKNILSYRSPVFNDIFQSKSQEKASTWVLDISDIGSDILDIMLKYMYSEFLECLEWETAKKLYVAAHKYKIPSLVNECSIFLKFHATPRNLPQLLKLASEHKDDGFQISVQNLIKFYEF